MCRFLSYKPQTTYKTLSFRTSYALMSVSTPRIDSGYYCKSNNSHMADVVMRKHYYKTWLFQPVFNSCHMTEILRSGDLGCLRYR